MHDWRWGMLLILVAACSKPSLPPLPTVNTTAFSPSIRTEIDAGFAAVRAAPRDASLNGRLGMLLHAHDRLEAASVCYERARSLQPKDYRWLYLSAVVYSSLSRNPEAVQLFQKALAEKPGDVPARLRLADALLADSKYGASRVNYERVMQDRPSDATAYFGLGRTYASEGNVARAAELYREACNRYPRYGAAQYALGLAYRQLGRDNEARAHLQLYEQDKTSAPPREDPLLAEVQELSGGILPLLAKAKVAASAGRLDQAVDLHRQALEIDPQQEQIHINLISLYGRLKQFDKAEVHYRATVARNPNSAEAHYNYAVMLMAQGQSAEAIAAYQRTIEANPSHAEAHNNLAYLLALSRKFEEALEHANKALESKPDYPQAHYNASMILLQRGQPAAAIRHLETATKQDPGEPRYLNGLATAYARAGNAVKAREYEQRAKGSLHTAQ